MISKKRLYQIDLLRILSAFFVLMYHYTFRGFMSKKYLFVEYPFLSKFFKDGYLGVSLFFMISGFVILMSVQNKTISGFVKSRFLRLYPAYWVCLLVSFFTILIFGAPYLTVSFFDLFSNFTMFNGFLKLPYVDGAYWSLLVEMKFYILMFLFILLKGKYNFKVDYFIILYILLSLISMISDIHPYKLYTIVNYFLTFKYSSFFISGMIFYMIYKVGLNFKYLLQLLICYSMSIFWSLKEVNIMENQYNLDFSETVTIIYVSVFYIVMFLISTGKLEVLNRKVFLKFGVLTYPLYLLHQNIGYIILNKFSNYINKYILLILLLAFVFVLANFISNKIEPKFYKFLKSIIESNTFMKFKKII